MSTLKKCTNYCNSAIKRLTPILNFAREHSGDVTHFTAFQTMYIESEKVFNKFQDLHINLKDEYEEEDIDSLEELVIKLDEMYFRIKAAYLESVKGIEAAHNLPEEPVPCVKLPRIQVPTFSGNILEWPTFNELYRALVHNNNQISDIEKFHYLLTSLSQEPLSIVKTLPLTAANYPIAFKSLTDRYDNKRVLAFTYWQNIHDAPKVLSNSAQSFRSLLNAFSENLAALKVLNLDLWDFTLVNWLLQKLDTNTKRRYETEYCNLDLPTFQSLNDFLTKECKALESMSLGGAITQSASVSTNKKPNDPSSYKKPHRTQFSPNQVKTFITKTDFPSCMCCKRNHHLFQCEAFIAKDINERNLCVTTNRLCSNCLGKHAHADCPSKSTCRVCQLRHHTLLHGTALSCQPSTSSTVLTTSISNHSITVLLSTAIVLVRNSENVFVPCRALIDSASQSSFMTENCFRKLKLQNSFKSVSIQGVNQMSSAISAGSTRGFLRSSHNIKPLLETEFLILPSICDLLPSSKINIQKWSHIEDLVLADPTFAIPSKVELLLGADLFPLILKDGIRTGSPGQPSAINTIFGWVLSGKILNAPTSKLHSFFTCLNENLDSTLKKFWELETIPSKVLSSPEDFVCENHYLKNVSRSASGRYTVALPFRDPDPKIGNSYNSAYKRLRSLERRLSKDPQLRIHYSNFLQDYLDSGHMSLIKDKNSVFDDSYFIPHHCIQKLDSSTTPLRVVFDASASASDGESLNDKLMIGPKLQQDIFSLLLRFRLHSIVFTADIKQMYRQIMIKDEHQSFQQILWRFNQSDPVEIYQLKTVTYGVNCAPFLAIRTLLKLAEDEKERYPLASKILATDTYVDDLVTGCASPSEAFELQSQLLSLLSSGAFELRKWSSNLSSLLDSLPQHLRRDTPQSFDENDSFIKVLGLQWNSKFDYFTYCVQIVNTTCTKRSILSELARIFDPLGLLSPITLFAKHLMQRLWIDGVSWDDSPSEEICSIWSKYKSELPLLSQLQLPRQIVSQDLLACEIHGFCDASEVGYGASVYFRITQKSGAISVHLVAGKSKVCPLKTISIPRAELCAALLLSELMVFIINTYKEILSIDKIFAWSDSTVALNWIKSSPHLWKTFISNRVSQIQENISPEFWHHIPGAQNPSDCASRGLLPKELLSHSLWWAGPPWLLSSVDAWPASCPESKSTNLDIERKVQTFITVKEVHFLSDLLTRYSSLRKIQGIVAVIQRFLHNLRNKGNKVQGPLSQAELHKSLITLSKHVQLESFSSDLSLLQNEKPCSKPLRKLVPFLDEDGVLRVGGRLKHSQLDFAAKHPILLPSCHRLVELIIRHFHKNTLHTGPQTLRYLISQQFWILAAKRAINHCLSKCYLCFKHNPKSVNPVMGNLPHPRVSQMKPFSHTGVDFAGPFTITLGKYRGAKSCKAYLCLFICLSTKAMHLELASNLSSEAFIAAFRRFAARRGRISDMYSDCGTNFVGANRILSTYAQNASSDLSIKWHFNPPSSPHMGGLWEAGVKSVKGHLMKVIGTQILTYEELYTLLTQIESVLNSRPLCAMSSNPNDLLALTPNHFLVFEPVTSLPDENLEGVALNRLARWQLIQQFLQSIWRRWHVEYLHTLQQRHKWYEKSPNLQINSLVLIKQDNLPPSQWCLGRIMELHSGTDGVARVATLRTKQGVLKRPTVKLCVLPTQ